MSDGPPGGPSWPSAPPGPQPQPQPPPIPLGPPPEPAWRPDPTGRHEHRWFDGSTYTDQVADRGVRSTDRGEAPVAGPPPVVTAGQRWRTPVVVGAVTVVVALGAAGAFVLTRAGADLGEGTFSETITGDTAATVRPVTIPPGSVAIVTVEPDDTLDAVVGFTVAAPVAERVAELYTGGPFAAPATSATPRAAFALPESANLPPELDGAVALFRVDLGFAGETEYTFLAPGGTEPTVASVVVAGFAERSVQSAGSYDITIDVVALDAGDDPSADDLLDAILASPEVPEELKVVIDDTLDEGG